jgi:hypothetical protein
MEQLQIYGDACICYQEEVCGWRCNYESTKEFFDSRENLVLCTW